MRLSRPDARRAQAVVLEHATEALGQSPTAASLELVSRRREVVVAQDLGNTTESPQSALDALHQGFEGLAKGDAHPAPAAEAELEGEQQVSQRLAGQSDAQVRSVREVHYRLASRRVDLRKDHLACRPTHSLPVADAPLQSSQLPRGEAPGMALLQLLEEPSRLENPLLILLQQRHNL